MAVLEDGVQGGSDGAIHQRWQADLSTYDDAIACALSHTRWLQIKRTIKLCDNRTAPKRGEEGYEPAYKYDFIVKTLIHNINCLTAQAELDLCGDETTWAHMGFGERQTSLLARVMRKPGVTKGGQTIILTDVHRRRPRAYLHRHKCHVAPQGWTRKGPVEVRLLMEKIRHLVRESH